jgi:hypothetical protein
MYNTIGTIRLAVFNIDWPLASDVGNAVRQQQSLQGILDGLVKLNANTALLQVRPECDSLYKSAIEPWSRFLTGTQGRDPGMGDGTPVVHGWGGMWGWERRERGGGEGLTKI